jgi:glycosyltransferase involved in cell wall biosynthesis
MLRLGAIPYAAWYRVMNVRDALAAAMVALSTDSKLRRRLATARQERVVRRFSVVATKAEWIALYEELAGHTLRL